MRHRGRKGLVAAWMAVALAITSPAMEAEPIFAGVDANYSLDMMREGKTWSWGELPGDLFSGMGRQGARGFRVRLWTGEEGVHGRTYATEIVRRALAAGLDPYLVIFLSEDWADLMKQPAPAAWKDLDIPERAEAIRKYSREIVQHFRKEGLRSHLYEIGNEIDYGICGVYPGKGTKKNPTSLSRSCWPDAARLVLAAQEGVREADPEAKFLLHIAHWWDPEFCVAFFQFMLGQGVTVDFAGLSYFPSSNIGGSLEMEQFGEVATRLHATIQRPIIVPETAYPSTANFTGQFERWKKAAPGYPLTPDGQRRWLEDFLRYCAHHPAIHSVYYWSPEWYGEGMWKAFALFDARGEAKPAWTAFSQRRQDQPALGKATFFELRDGALHRVPVEAARHEAQRTLAEEREKFGGVNVEYIKAISARKLVVEGYEVVLRASLSGNLDLTFAGRESADANWRSQLEGLQAGDRMVIFAAEEDPELLAAIQREADGKGAEVLLHPQPIDQPLKFGLAKNTASPAGGID